ncbi:hypothetical protein FF38_04875 [Lucilia cuprina]|uniref:Uncharacterized protein n=1 Tax=Lucilia cuprina TaxID=7375 RepID=A0A0L0C8N0_LUCCU|nr:hypothetical protein FF38_04875 [Lucilia cuprina]
MISQLDPKNPKKTFDKLLTTKVLLSIKYSIVIIEREIVLVLLVAQQGNLPSPELLLLSSLQVPDVNGREPEVTVVIKGFCTNTASDLEGCSRFSQYKVPKGCTKEAAKLFVIKYFGLLVSFDEEMDFVNVVEVDDGVSPAVYDRRETGNEESEPNECCLNSEAFTLIVLLGDVVDTNGDVVGAINVFSITVLGTKVEFIFTFVLSVEMAMMMAYSTYTATVTRSRLITAVTTADGGTDTTSTL